MTRSDSRIAVYTGSFDPITLGHLNVIERAARLVDTLIVGIGVNTEKAPLFSPEDRVALVTQATADVIQMRVEGAWRNTEFVRQCGSRVMVRGVRPLTDLAGEFTMMMANKHLDPGIETVFLMADEEFAHVSSSLLKQIAPLADDDMLARFVPQAIIPALRAKIKRQT